MHADLLRLLDGDPSRAARLVHHLHNYSGSALRAAFAQSMPEHARFAFAVELLRVDARSLCALQITCLRDVCGGFSLAQFRALLPFINLPEAPATRFRPDDPRDPWRRFTVHFKNSIHFMPFEFFVALSEHYQAPMIPGRGTFFTGLYMRLNRVRLPVAAFRMQMSPAFAKHARFFVDVAHRFIDVKVEVHALIRTPEYIEDVSAAWFELPSEPWLDKQLECDVEMLEHWLAKPRPLVTRFTVMTQVSDAPRVKGLLEHARVVEERRDACISICGPDYGWVFAYEDGRWGER